MIRSGDLREAAARICRAALRAVDPEAAVLRLAQRRGDRLLIGPLDFELDRFDNIWVIGAGKAAAPMARAVERVLRGGLAGGLLVTKYGHGLPLRKLELLEAGHPLPDRNSFAAGERMTAFVRGSVGPRDLVLCLLSGGGSALLAAPAEGLEWQDKAACTELLLKAGASIHDLNAVRKHLSAIKGGGLARLLPRAEVVSLILSDVVGDDLDTVASGPLVPDPTTYADCLAAIDRLGIRDALPRAVLRRLKRGAAGRIAETPKPGDPSFRKKENVIIASNARACTAAARAARRLGYHTAVLTSRGTGDTAESARFHMAVAQEVVAEERPVRRPACLISGGETTVQVKGRGKGGRNQEFVLHCVRILARLPAPCLVLSLGTDGTDGPTDAAGAVADNSTLVRALRFGPRFLDDCLSNNDSYRFFDRLNDLVMTGPTRTNVMDLHIILIGAPGR